jgi:prophage regulatory protein
MKHAKALSPFDELPDDAFIRLPRLIAWGLIPFSASTLWRKCRSGQFPQPLRVSSQVTAWRVGDIREWLKNPGEFVCQNRISHRNDKLSGVQ